MTKGGEAMATCATYPGTTPPVAGERLYRVELRFDVDGEPKSTGLLSGLRLAGVPDVITRGSVEVLNLDLPCPVLPRLPERPSFWFRQKGWDEFRGPVGALKADVREYARGKCGVVDLVTEYDPERHVLRYFDEYQVAVSDAAPGRSPA